MFRSFSVLALEERENKMACGALAGVGGWTACRRGWRGWGWGWKGHSDYIGNSKARGQLREPARSVLVGSGSSRTPPSQSLGTKFLPEDFPKAMLLL